MAGTRVLHLMQCTYLGGTEQTMYALMSGLHGHGYDFKIVSMHPPGEGAALMAAAGIPTIGHEYRGKFGWRTHWSLRRTIARTPCDLCLVTAPSVSGTLALSAATSRHRILTVHTYHGNNPAKRRQWQAYYRLYGHQYGAITFLTDFLREEALSIAPWIAPRARTVRAPAVTIGRVESSVRAEVRRQWGLDEDAFVVGNAARLEPGKRLDVFLDVAARVAKELPRAQFLIAGDGPNRSMLEAQASELGIRDRVHFLGWLRDARGFFNSLDVLLFNSDADAFGRTPMEAMAVGVPVVASVRYGGTSELIEHGLNGLLLTEHDVSMLTQGVLTLAGNTALRETWIDRGLQTVRELHGYEAFLRTYREMFESVLAA